MLDAFIGKQKLKDALSGVLKDVKYKTTYSVAFLHLSLNNLQTTKTNESKAPNIDKNLFPSTSKPFSLSISNHWYLSFTCSKSLLIKSLKLISGLPFLLL